MLHRDIGLVRARLEHYSEAADAFGRAIELAPGEPDLRILRAEALQRAGRQRDALECWMALAEADETKEMAVFHAGTLAHDLGCLAACRGFLEAILERKPSCAPAHFWLLRLELTRLGFPRALRHYRALEEADAELAREAEGRLKRAGLITVGGMAALLLVVLAGLLALLHGPGV